jgi:hypothetical protein
MHVIFAATGVAFEDELDALGTAQIEVVGHECLEERASVAWRVVCLAASVGATWQRVRRQPI